MNGLQSSLFSGGAHARKQFLNGRRLFLPGRYFVLHNATQQGLSEGNAAMNIFTGYRMAKRKNVRVQR